ncbi:HSF-type DNA-binding-domain-containing protein [Chlamydoabsidia padenii]|nr:HSF-type DNA-binding-domain-containing protein [Chlamydoabsidia padenii]
MMTRVKKTNNLNGDPSSSSSSSTVSSLSSSSDKRLSPFVKKLWGYDLPSSIHVLFIIFFFSIRIMNDKSLHSIIRWTEQGTTVCISNSILFCKSVLPHYFKHNNWHSFVRQLNLYGFRKVYHFNIAIDYASGRQETVWQFKHRHFHRDSEDSLILIQRKLPSCQLTQAAKNQKITKLLAGIEKRLEVAEKEHEEVRIETQHLRQQHQDQQKILFNLMEQVALVTKRLTSSHSMEDPGGTSCFYQGKTPTFETSGTI